MKIVVTQTLRPLHPQAALTPPTNISAPSTSSSPTSETPRAELTCNGKLAVVRQHCHAKLLRHFARVHAGVGDARLQHQRHRRVVVGVAVEQVRLQHSSAEVVVVVHYASQQTIVRHYSPHHFALWEAHRPPISSSDSFTSLQLLLKTRGRMEAVEQWTAQWSILSLVLVPTICCQLTAVR